jgi:hypothetical protein
MTKPVTYEELYNLYMRASSIGDTENERTFNGLNAVYEAGQRAAAEPACEHAWEARQDRDGLFVYCLKCTLCIPVNRPVESACAHARLEVRGDGQETCLDCGRVRHRTVNRDACYHHWKGTEPLTSIGQYYKDPCPKCGGFRQRVTPANRTSAQNE